MSPIDNFNMDVSFWEANPIYKTKEPFKSLYKKDKTKGKKPSSDMMWFVTLCYDMKSEWWQQEFEVRVLGLSNEFMDDDCYFEHNEDKIIELGEGYTNFNDTAVKAELRAWKEMLQDRGKFIKSTKYSEATYEMLDKMGGVTKKLWDDYGRIMKELSTEEGADGVLGGEMESLNDD
jgi:hypothetical protein